jgi:hypothetical protein
MSTKKVEKVLAAVAVISFIVISIVVIQIYRDQREQVRHKQEKIIMTHRFISVFEIDPGAANSEEKVYAEIDRLVGLTKTSFVEWNKEHYKVALETYLQIINQGVIPSLRKACIASEYFGYEHPACTNIALPHQRNK